VVIVSHNCSASAGGEIEEAHHKLSYKQLDVDIKNIIISLFDKLAGF
jgi:hypothetical protein